MVIAVEDGAGASSVADRLGLRDMATSHLDSELYVGLVFS